MSTKTSPPTQRVSPSRWYRSIELWYIAYALLGMVGLGMIRFLIPLAVTEGGNPTQVGLVVAAVNIGGLTAPVWGGLADRKRWHRLLLSGGMVLTGMGLAIFTMVHGAGLWILLALVQGIGVAAATTMGNLLVIEAHPRSEWDQRIGWLQTFNGGGQTAGFLVAGFLSNIGPDFALLVSAGVAVSGALIGWLTARTPAAPSPENKAERGIVVRPPETIEWGHGSIQHHFYLHVRRSDINKAGKLILSPFGFFLVIYGLTALGSMALIGLFPLIMKDVFQINPARASVLLTISALVGMLFYMPSGYLTKSFGNARVLHIALILRVLAGLGLVCLALLGVWPIGVILLCCIAFTSTWAAVMVACTNVAGHLAPEKGVGMGMFSATFYLAGVLGAALGGCSAHLWGYQAPLVLCVVATALALVLELIRWWRKPLTERRAYQVMR
jgi:DHA1 family tetracycline resistance protein-like MFS transporter